MKKFIYNILAFFLVACIVTSCDENSIFEKEQYKPVLYLLSTNNQTYTQSYSLNETEPEKYFTIGCGGSNTNAEEISVVLEPDTILLGRYNKSNFDIDTASFAKLLPADCYNIPSMTVTFPANNPDQYVKVPVKVNLAGLSPDSIYFIPLSIKSVSKYEVNPDKKNMLYRVVIENDYAKQGNITYYHLKGTAMQGGKEGAISGSKPVYPLSSNTVRMYAGAAVVQSANSKVPDIKKYSIIVKVNADNSLEITPYGTIEIEQVDDPKMNYFEVFREQQHMYLHYKYKVAGTSNWIAVKETLRRLE